MFPAKAVTVETLSSWTGRRQLVKLLLMETPRELPIVAGHLALDFANTVDDPEGTARHDHAATYDDLLHWSLRVGTLDDRRATTLRRAAKRRDRDAVAALAAAHELRDALNVTFAAVARGAPDLPPSWARLRDLGADAQACARLSRREDGRLEWSWAEVKQLTAPLHPIASAAVDLLVSDDLGRVKQCARCPWLFLDVSKNHSRRWCDMDDCGRAEKIERYLARRAARREAR